MDNIKFKYVTDGCEPKTATSLDQLFGQKKTLNLPFQQVHEMEAALKSMNLIDIRSLAVKLGLKPIGDRPKLVRGCIDQFNRLTKTYGSAKAQNSENAVKFDPRSL